MRDRIQQSGFTTTRWFYRLHDSDPWVETLSYSGHLTTDRCRDEDFGRLIIEHHQVGTPIGEVIVPASGGGEFRYTDYVPNWGGDWYSQQGPLESIGKPKFWFGTAQQRAVRLAAMTNVSTPVVDVGQFLGELKDLPNAILQRGRQGISWAKSESLGVRFGIMPMVSDILQMANIADYTRRKTEQLQSLLYSKGMRRKVKMGQANATWTVDLPNLGSGAYALCQNNITRWGTIWWKPGGDLMTFDVDDPDKTKLIRGLLTGTSKYNDRVSYLADAWELLPWSWLADWCGDLGNYLKATQNQTISTVDTIWLMETSVSDQVIITPSGSTSSHIVRKEREVGNITPSTTAPFISGDRAAILSGLFIRSPSPIPARYR